MLYPSLHVSFSIPDRTRASLSTGLVVIRTSPDHGYIDPDTGSPSCVASRYYGGSISFSPAQNEWSSQAVFRIDTTGDDVIF